MKTEKYANVDVKYISRRPTLYVENLNKYQNKQRTTVTTIKFNAISTSIQSQYLKVNCGYSY